VDEKKTQDHNRTHPDYLPAFAHQHKNGACPVWPRQLPSKIRGCASPLALRIRFSLQAASHVSSLCAHAFKLQNPSPTASIFRLARHPGHRGFWGPQLPVTNWATRSLGLSPESKPAESVANDNHAIASLQTTTASGSEGQINHSWKQAFIKQLWHFRLFLCLHYHEPNEGALYSSKADPDRVYLDSIRHRA
jgi:hypothetical protein